MSAEDDSFIHFYDQRHLKPRSKEDLERLVNLYLSRLQNERHAGYIFFEPATQEKPFDPNEQILKLSSEVQELRNKVNKYMKIEEREESIGQLSQLVSEVSEIKEIYVQHKADSVVFFVFYDQGDKFAMLEKIVEIEIELEKIFKTLNFDFRVLPYSEAGAKMFSSADMIYSRKETKGVNAQSRLA